MKRLTLYSSIVLALASVTAACEKEIEFTGEIRQPRLTLSARAVAGEPFTAYVASSIFFLDAGKGGAAFKEGLDTLAGTVRLFVNGDKEGTEMLLDSGGSVSAFCYAADYVPAPDDRIRIEAEFPGFDKVRAETTVPGTPVFELLSVESRPMDFDLYGDGTMYYDVDITLAVSDDASYSKYYFIQPLARYKNPFSSGTGDLEDDEVLSSLVFRSNDMIFRTPGNSGLDQDFETSFGGAYFSDELIKGRRHIFKITVPFVQAPELTSLFGLKLAAADENLYWYDYSYSRLEMSAGGLFSEAVSLYSNVQGGYGILCAAAPMWIDIDW